MRMFFLLLLISLFIWGWVDSGLLVGVELVILTGFVLWVFQTAISGVSKLFNRDEISMTQNVFYDDHPDPTRPDEHPLLQLRRDQWRRRS